MARKSKLGSLLMDADIITKKQLSEAVDKQTNGDDKELGQILTGMGYITVEDLTEVMLGEAKDAQSEREKSKRDRLLQKQILQKKITPKPVAPKAVPISAKTPVVDEEILKKKVHAINSDFGKRYNWNNIFNRNVVCAPGRYTGKCI